MGGMVGGGCGSTTVATRGWWWLRIDYGGYAWLVVAEDRQSWPGMVKRGWWQWRWVGEASGVGEHLIDVR